MKIISLSHDEPGTACSIGVAIKKYFYNGTKVTDFFDYLIVSMKSVNEVLMGKPIEFVNKKSLEDGKINFKNFNKIISIHDIHDIRKKNSNISENEIINELKEKYNRRRDRLINSINENETIFFLRYYTNNNMNDREEFIKFMNNIKKLNPSLHFHLILITTNYREQKTFVPIRILNFFQNVHMLFLDNYLTSEENKLNHLNIDNDSKFDSFVSNLKPINKFVYNIENKVNKNAVVILTRGYSDINNYYSLIQRNKSINKNLKDKSTDILIFNEGNISLFQQEYIKYQTPDLNIKFITITNKAFLKINERFPFYEPTKRDVWNFGYRHMCHFWFLDFLHFCEDYEFILRIDEDCFVDFNIDEIFKLIPSKFLIAGALDDDNEEVTYGLNSFTLNFLKKHGIKKNSKKSGGPYTNVLALNLLRIRKNEFLKKYMKEVDNSNNIYIYRWGDLPLWGEVINYFYDKKDIFIYNRINYYHGSLNTYVNNLTKDMQGMLINKKINDQKKNLINSQIKSTLELGNSQHLLFPFHR